LELKKISKRGREETGRGEGPFPPPFPKGKGAKFVISKVNVQARMVIASPL
jgi:hypothetical protein